jgi:Flp pilus assembly protein TadD
MVEWLVQIYTICYLKQVSMSKKQSKQSKNPRTLPRRLAEGLDSAFQLVEQNHLDEALGILEDLDRRYPDEPEILAQLAHIFIEQENWEGFLYASEHLAPHAPDDADLQLGLAGAYLTNGYPASALTTIRAFLQRWPDHEDVEDALQMQAELEEEIGETYSLWNVDPADGLALIRDYEAVRILLDQGRVRQAITKAEALLQRKPDSLTLLNTLSMAYWSNGQVEKAIATARQALDSDPQDPIALGNLAQFSLLTGKVDEALGYAQQLKAVAGTGDEQALKWMEVASHLGEDMGILEAFEDLERKRILEDMGPQAAYLYHLAATAWVRQNKIAKGQALWKKALDLLPEFELAQGNLADLDRPVSERNGPYAHTFQHWFSPKAGEDLERAMQSVPQGNTQALERAMRGWMARHPEFVPLAPYLLRLGDETVREFVLSMVDISRHPELLLAAKEFALGKVGRDELRLGAANLCAQAGVLLNGKQRMWLNGKWTDTLLMGIDLQPSESVHHASKVDNWLRTALRSAHEGQYKQAEVLLKQALEIEPDAPDLQFNLAAAYQSQGWLEEADALIKLVYERFPDYLFARVNLAQVEIHRGELENARLLLEPLRKRTQMSYNEFDVFCAAHIELSLAEKDNLSAQAWFGTWESANPENPKLERYRGLLE